MENLPQNLINIINAHLFVHSGAKEQSYNEAEEQGKKLNVEAKNLKKEYKAQNVDVSEYVEDETAERIITLIGNTSVTLDLGDTVLLKKLSVMPSCFGRYENVMITADVINLYGKKKISECLRVLDIAHTKFIKAGKALNWQYELEYMKVYECVKDNQELWFEGIFLIDEHKTFTMNFVIAERLTAILGTYCLILRQRGNIKKADSITKTVYTRSLERHLELAKAIKRKDAINSNSTIRYKWNQIKLNLAYQHYRESEYVPICREILKFELENFLDFDQAMYLEFVCK